MESIEEVKAKLAMAASGLEKTREKAEGLDEVDDEALTDIENARESARRALKRIDGEK